MQFSGDGSQNRSFTTDGEWVVEVSRPLDPQMPPGIDGAAGMIVERDIFQTDGSPATGAAGGSSVIEALVKGATLVTPDGDFRILMDVPGTLPAMRERDRAFRSGRTVGKTIQPSGEKETP
jgi:hypothetical protein